MHLSVLDLQDGRDQLQHRRRRDAVADHRLGGVDRDPVGLRSERDLQGSDLDRVPERGGGRVGVDVVHLVGAPARVGEGTVDRPHLAVDVRPGETARVPRRGSTKDLGPDPGSPRPGAAKGLEHHRRCALARDEPLAQRVERAAGPLRRVVERPERDRLDHRQRMQDHRVGRKRRAR